MQVTTRPLDGSIYTRNEDSRHKRLLSEGIFDNYVWQCSCQAIFKSANSGKLI